MSIYILLFKRSSKENIFNNYSFLKIFGLFDYIFLIFTILLFTFN